MAVTIEDIVRGTGVPHSTVFRALSGIGVENTESRKNILRLAQEMGYMSNQAAINLKKPRSYVIGLYFSTISKITPSLVLHDVPTGVYSVAGSKYNVMVKGIGMYEPGTLNPSHFDGTTVLPRRSEDIESTNEVLDGKIPMSVICRAVDVDVSNVTTDGVLAMERAMDYLLENGHQNIDIIEGNPGLDSGRLRRRGWRTSMTSHELDPDVLPAISGNYRYTSGHTVAEQLLTFRPMVLSCFNDETAFDARTATVEAGLKVPDDVSLVGSGNWDMSGYSDMYLTAVERDMGEIAKEGARVLSRRLDEGIVDNRRIYLNNKLMVGDTARNLNVGERKPS